MLRGVAALQRASASASAVSDLSTHDEQSTMDVWSRLPDALVQQVLSLFAVPDLCRNIRPVCKRWNSLICTPEFGNLCAQNANEDDARFIFGRCFHRHVDDTTAAYFIAVVGWNIFDVKERRWYAWKLNTFANDHPLASVGGLVLCCSTVAGTTKVSEMTIANPIGKTRKVVPYPPFSDLWTDCIVNLVVDSISRTYKIFLINRHRDPYLCVFESTTNQWRSSSTIPVQLQGGDTGRLSHSVMFQGLLFILSKVYTGRVPPQKFWLHSYNFQTDSWVDCRVDFPEWPDNGGNRIELIVSGNRLFVFLSNYSLDLEASHGSFKVTGDPIRVTEILLADRTLHVVSELAELPSFDAQGLEVNLAARAGPWTSFEFNHAFGLGNSIMLTYKWLEYAIVYNVVTCLWEMMPTDPTVVLDGQAMPLRLPSADLW